ncbi:hypothetical protein BDQ12DRAFT_636561, partial [Crucibulum laeve]
MIVAQSYLPWKVSLTILHVITALSSLLRVEHRRRTRRLWWDDYASIVPAIFVWVMIAVIWLRLRHFGMFWWSRISLALAVVRITPLWSKTRQWVIGCTCAFIVTWVAILLIVSVSCAVNTDWQHLKADMLVCGLTHKVTLVSVPTNFIGDVMLIAFPLYRLWYIKLRPAQRRLVLLVFSTSILTLVGEVVVAIVAFGRFLHGPEALLL